MRIEKINIPLDLQLFWQAIDIDPIRVSFRDLQLLSGNAVSLIPDYSFHPGYFIREIGYAMAFEGSIISDGRPLVFSTIQYL